MPRHNPNDFYRRLLPGHHFIGDGEVLIRRRIIYDPARTENSFILWASLAKDQIKLLLLNVLLAEIAGRIGFEQKAHSNLDT